MQTLKKDIKLFFTLLFAACLFYGGLHFLGIGCPIKAVTGISCPGCGMTRAWFALLCGDVKTAFHYHPLFWAPPVCVVFYMVRQAFGATAKKLFVIAVCALFICVYACRMANPMDDVVTFQPEQSILYFAWQMGKTWLSILH